MEDKTHILAEPLPARAMRVLGSLAFEEYAALCQSKYGTRFDVNLKDLIASGGQGHVYEADFITGVNGDVKVRTVLAKLMAKDMKDIVSDAVASRRYAKETSVPTLLRGKARSQEKSNGLVDYIPEVVYYAEMNSERGAFYYILFAHNQGVTLNEILKRNAPLSPENAARIFLPVAEVMQMMDESQLVHRDIKPENIFITGEGRSTLIDYGLVKHLSEYEHVILGNLVGTPLYMAPESLLTPRAPLTHSADVFGLGKTMYKALGGIDAYADFSEFNDPTKGTELSGEELAVRMGGIYQRNRAPTSLTRLRPELASRRGAALAELVETAIRINPTNRPRISEIVDGLVEVLPSAERANYESGERPKYTVGEVIPFVKEMEPLELGKTTYLRA